MVKSYLLVLTVYLPENGLVFTESTGNKWAPDDRDGRERPQECRYTTHGENLARISGRL